MFLLHLNVAFEGIEVRMFTNTKSIQWRYVKINSVENRVVLLLEYSKVLSHMVNLHICHRINPFIFYNVMQNMFKLHQAKTQKDQTCIAFSRQRRFVILPYNDYAVLIVYAKHEFDLKSPRNLNYSCVWFGSID